MNFALLLIMITGCAALLWWGCLAKGRIYEFPFLAGATFFGFILPQAVGLLRDRDLPGGALQKTFVMAILCAAMCYVGYVWRKNPLRSFQWSFEQRRLLQVSAVLSAVGAWFFQEISHLPEELTGVTQWSGVPVAYLFFAQILSYGFAIAVLLFFKTNSKWALGIALFDACFYLDRIFIAGRRGVALEFVFIVVLGAWFGRGRALPKWAMISAILGGTLALHSTGYYRGVTLDEEGPQWNKVTEIPMVANLRELMANGGNELRNVVYMIEAADETADFDYGLFHWNTLVFNYVPAQVVGEEFKQSLMISLKDVAADLFGYEANVGTTRTGLVDSFRSFWYLGCLKFLLIGFVMSKLYSGAVTGNTTAQLYYMLIIVPSLHSITHHTQWFVSPWVHMGIFLLPGLIFARVRKQKLARHNPFSPLLVSQTSPVPALPAQP